MPPKKGKKGKKGKPGKKGAGKGSAKEVEGEEIPDPKEKEILLQEELDEITKEVDTAKARVDELKEENEWLQQEAHKVRTESHEYMSYMEKKTSKRQTTIISLSDQHQREIHDLDDEKQEMLADYGEKKAILKTLLLEKEHLMAKTKQELDELQEFKTLQKDQLSQIKDLEKEVVMMRGKHSDSIMQLKSRFLHEKEDFLQDSEAKVAAMAKQANHEALQCLTEHTTHIKQENRRLRQRLLLLIHKTRALHEHKRRLEAQRNNLRLEQQYARDLKTLRSARQHQVLKSFGMLRDDDDDDDNATPTVAASPAPSS